MFGDYLEEAGMAVFKNSRSCTACRSLTGSVSQKRPGSKYSKYVFGSGGVVG
jgi:hypothetical protein